MNYTIHHISASAHIFRFPESCSLFILEQGEDDVYVKKREYCKNTLL
ncbi:hypothetical protein C8N46_11036 [Kordia periserrulae]|uniref:Uncharacterized protein n=1 Tax=Kordia periserrulae TaxID=701523 RepID=A0A2T6BSY6_9FLAO|nr:hypothetical protein [Kordia periserrulae]PTX59201.1 hypothetical protein C8N46_11036 [Kordia periserrulae]